MSKIAVLMSTYNGEKYLDEQIESIFSQEDTEISLWVRDDGSTDETLPKVDAWMKKKPGQIHLLRGENVGYKRSFLHLLANVPDGYDYYAFADQDDIWLTDKCKAAVEMLDRDTHEVKLYTSNLEVVNESLEYLYTTRIEHNFRISLYGFWIRGRFAGCTYLFNEGAKKKAISYADLNLPDAGMPSHDFIVGTLAFLYGTVIFDTRTFIQHRRLETSVTSGGRGIVNRLQTETKYLFKRKDIRYTLAKELLARKEAGMDPEAESFLNTVAGYKQNLPGKWRLLSSPLLHSGSFIFDAQAKIKVLLANF